MESIKKIVAVWKYQMRLQVWNSKTLFVFILLFFYLRGYTEPIVEFSDAVGVKITPFLFPLFMNDWIIPIIVSLGFLVLICDAPFVKRGYLFLISRTGKACWLIGEGLFLLSFAVFYTFGIYVLTLLNTLPMLSFDAEWGKIIMSLVRTNASEKFHTIAFDAAIVENFLAVEALTKTMILCVLLFWTFGMLVFSLNYFLKNSMGVVAGVIVTFWDLAIYNLFDDFALRRYSPVSLMKLTNTVGESMWNITYSEAIGTFIIGIVILFISIFVYAKCNKGIYLDNGRREG